MYLLLLSDFDVAECFQGSLRDLVEKLEDDGYITETLSLGESKFMVSSVLRALFLYSPRDCHSLASYQTLIIALFFENTL